MNCHINGAAVQTHKYKQAEAEKSNPRNLGFASSFHANMLSAPQRRRKDNHCIEPSSQTFANLVTLFPSHCSLAISLLLWLFLVVIP